MLDQVNYVWVDEIHEQMRGATVLRPKRSLACTPIGCSDPEKTFDYQPLYDPLDPARQD